MNKCIKGTPLHIVTFTLDGRWYNTHKIKRKLNQLKDSIFKLDPTTQVWIERKKNSFEVSVRSRSSFIHRHVREWLETL